MSEIQPWERQADEPRRWFQRFEAFRLMGPGRTLMAVYRLEWAKRVAKSREESHSQPRQVSGRWRKVAELYSWQERAEAWDAHETARRQAEIDRANADHDAEWRARHLREAELMGRLAEVVTANVTDFIERSPVAVTEGTGDNAQTVYIESASLKWDVLARRGHLVRKISFNRHGPVLEMEPRMQAIEKIGEYLDLWRTKTGASLNVDVSQLTTEQLERIANGEDPLSVIATSSASGA